MPDTNKPIALETKGGEDLPAPGACPSCGSQLRESLINDNYMACPSCETFFRKQAETVSPEEEGVKESYRERAISILYSDKKHYEQFYSNPFIVEKFRIPLMNRDLILAVGGGHPKLESYLNPKTIEICDLFPDVYLEALEQFRSVYSYDGEIRYHRVKIDESYSPPVIRDGGSFLITFVHFLEHLDYQSVSKVMGNLPGNTDVAIYGPNPEKKPIDHDWIHFRPADHLTLIPLKRFRDLLSDMGYVINYYTAYSDDLLIYFNTSHRGVIG